MTTTTYSIDEIAEEIAEGLDMDDAVVLEGLRIYLGQCRELDEIDYDEDELPREIAEFLRECYRRAHEDDTDGDAALSSVMPTLDRVERAEQDLARAEQVLDETPGADAVGEGVLEAVWAARDRVAQVATTLSYALDLRDEAIREALRAGVSYRDLGEATGLSRARLDQIRVGARS